MKLYLLILLSALTSAQGWASVSAYFNHNPNKNYLDPYRGFRRSGDNLEKVIIDQIKSAKKSVYIAVQELRLPLVAKALVDKKNAGVDVRVVLEHDYNFTVLTKKDPLADDHEATRAGELHALVDLNGDGRYSKSELESRDAIYMLKAAKIKIVDDSADGSEGSGLMHHKFVIVDGKSTIITTANFTLSCVHGDLLTESSRGNANSLVLVDSPALAKIFTEQFLEMWAQNFGSSKAYIGPQKVVVDGQGITIQFSPTSQRYNWEDSVNGLAGSFLARATRSIKAALFVFSDQKMSDVMQKRHNEGVRIGVLIEPKFAYREYSELLDMLGLKLLSPLCAYEEGNRPWKNKASEVGMTALPSGDVLHHKFGVIDNKIVIVGSQNWTESANKINDETLIVIEGKSISEQYTQEYNRLLKTSKLDAPETLKVKIKEQELKCSQSANPMRD